jgi:acetyl-CoA C-acetyltransferase
MARACVVGAGMTKFGVHDEPLEELFADAALSAIHDAGVDGDEIEGL